MYELHDLCKLFPRLGGAEFDALCQDIKANGLREPIVLHEGKILDGGNRYRACIEAGVDPLFVDFDGGNVVSFVLSANLHRRHLTAGQQAAIVATAQDWAKAQTVGKPKSGNVASLDRVEDRAAQSGASERTQRMADAVAKRDPELARKVAHGEVSLPKAAEQVGARTPPAKKKSSAPAPTPAPAPLPPAAETHPEESPYGSAEEIVHDLESDLRIAQARIADMEKSMADAGNDRLLDLHRRLDHAERSRDDAMQASAALQAKVQRLERDLAAIGRALGERDLDKVVGRAQEIGRRMREAA